MKREEKPGAADPTEGERKFKRQNAQHLPDCREEEEVKKRTTSSYWSVQAWVVRKKTEVCAVKRKKRRAIRRERICRAADGCVSHSHHQEW